MVARIGLVLVLLVAVGVTGLYAAAQQRPSAVTGLPTISPTASDAGALDAKIAALQSQVARASARATVTIMLTEQELTAKVAEYLVSHPSDPFHPTNPQVHLRNGNVILDTTIQVQGFALNLAVTATPQIVNGRLAFVLQSVDSGAISLPDFLKAQISTALAAALDPAALGLPLELTSVQVANGQLTLQGVKK